MDLFCFISVRSQPGLASLYLSIQVPEARDDELLQLGCTESGAFILQHSEEERVQKRSWINNLFTMMRSNQIFVNPCSLTAGFEMHTQHRVVWKWVVNTDALSPHSCLSSVYSTRGKELFLTTWPDQIKTIGPRGKRQEVNWKRNI